MGENSLSSPEIGACLIWSSSSSLLENFVDVMTVKDWMMQRHVKCVRAVGSKLYPILNTRMANLTNVEVFDQSLGNLAS